MFINTIEYQCESFLKSLQQADSAHDLAHIKRVVSNARKLLKTESADSEVIITAAWLHDCIVLSKNHPERKKASKLAADKAVSFLKSTDFPISKLDQIHHAILTHSFSADIKPETLEAKIVQDADRIDALGAVGIARCFAVSGQLNRPLYNPDDPFCESRDANDLTWTLDHFYTKLFKLPGLMNTKAGKDLASTRVAYMKLFLEQFRNEIT